MPKLPCISEVRVVKVLKRRQRGNHVVSRRGSSVCVVPLHREVDQGTLRGGLRQVGVTVEEFMEHL